MAKLINLFFWAVWIPGMLFIIRNGGMLYFSKRIANLNIKLKSGDFKREVDFSNVIKIPPIVVYEKFKKYKSYASTVKNYERWDRWSNRVIYSVIIIFVIRLLIFLFFENPVFEIFNHR